MNHFLHPILSQLQTQNIYLYCVCSHIGLPDLIIGCNKLSFFLSRRFKKTKLVPLSLSALLVACCPSPKDEETLPIGEIKLTPTHQLYSATSEAFSQIDKSLPKFACIQDVKDKKAQFFGYILQMVRAHNQDILQFRTSLSQLKQLNSQLITQASNVQPNSSVALFLVDEQQQEWLKVLAKKHQVKAPTSLIVRDNADYVEQSNQWFDELLRHIDIIPASMALAQSANESAWGTSRFALQANNLFGQWCFRAGCGLVPEQRPEGASYEVKKFRDPAEAVGQYMYNINRNDSYLKVRSLRHDARTSNQLVSGIELAEGLEKYSARGHAYIEELQAMIRYNKLMQWDNPEVVYPTLNLDKIPDC